MGRGTRVTGSGGTGRGTGTEVVTELLHGSAIGIGTVAVTVAAASVGRQAAQGQQQGPVLIVIAAVALAVPVPGQAQALMGTATATVTGLMQRLAALHAMDLAPAMDMDMDTTVRDMGTDMAELQMVRARATVLLATAGTGAQRRRQVLVRRLMLELQPLRRQCQSPQALQRAPRPSQPLCQTQCTARPHGQRTHRELFGTALPSPAERTASNSSSKGQRQVASAVVPLPPPALRATRRLQQRSHERSARRRRLGMRCGHSLPPLRLQALAWAARRSQAMAC